jgi:ribosomal protein L11 methyltransferase
MELWETRLEIPAAEAEAAELALLESGSESWFLVEDAVSRRAWIVGYFRSAAEARERRSALQSSLAFATSGDPVPRRLPDSDWKKSYREHFRAWTFGRLHWVPVWERGTYRLPPGHSALWLDPGMAFGTGNHETTRLCIERLVEFEEGLLGGADASELRVVDAGCGSGILALSACLLGFRHVSGFDVDPEAVRVSEENASLNGLSGRVGFATADLQEGLADRCAGVVLANIQADVLVRHASALVSAVAPGGLLAMSGILASESDAVRNAFSGVAAGWTADSRALGEWSDLCLRRPLSGT